MQLSPSLLTYKHPLPPTGTAKQFVIPPLLRQPNNLVKAQGKAFLATRSLSGIYSTHSQNTICTAPVRSVFKWERNQVVLAKNWIVPSFKAPSKPFGIFLWLLCFLVSKVNCYYKFYNHQHLTLSLCVFLCVCVGGVTVILGYVDMIQGLIFKDESTQQFSLFPVLPLRLQRHSRWQGSIHKIVSTEFVLPVATNPTPHQGRAFSRTFTQLLTLGYRIKLQQQADNIGNWHIIVLYQL